MISFSERIAARLQAQITGLWFSQSPHWYQRLATSVLALGTPITHRVAGTKRQKILAIRGRRQQTAAAPWPPVPVVVVGNLTVGGSGKTPLTIAICRALGERGLIPGIVCRGAGPSGAPTSPIDPRDNEAQAGDEALLLARATGVPVVACRDRASAVRWLLNKHPDTQVIVSDDGLQHAALPRDVEIAVFDKRGVGNGKLLPAGPLREPLAHLGGMDAVVINTGFAASPPTAIHNQSIPRFESPTRVRDIVPLSAWRTDDVAAISKAARPLGGWADRQRGGHSVAAMAGIGNPASFFDLLRTTGLTIEPIALADHAALTPAHFEQIREQAIVITEKDAVKCSGIHDSRVWVLRIEAVPPIALIDLILSRLTPPGGAQRDTTSEP